MGKIVIPKHSADVEEMNAVLKIHYEANDWVKSREYVEKLKLPQMVENNTDNHETAFTVSIDHITTTTGISAVERSITAIACVDENAKPEDFRRPGHMFPLKAKKNGVLERNGHTEATVDLCRLAGLKECGL